MISHSLQFRVQDRLYRAKSQTSTGVTESFGTPRVRLVLSEALGTSLTADDHLGIKLCLPLGIWRGLTASELVWAQYVSFINGFTSYGLHYEGRLAVPPVGPSCKLAQVWRVSLLDTKQLPYHSGLI